jgi:hypothetical protein
MSRGLATLQAERRGRRLMMKTSYDVTAALVTACLVLLLPDGRATGSEQEQGLQRSPIPGSQIHETLLGEARGTIVSVDVSGTDSSRHIAWVEEGKGGKTILLDGRQLAGPFDDVKLVDFRGPQQQLVVIAIRKSRWILQLGDREVGRDYTSMTPPVTGADGEVIVGACHEQRCQLVVDGRATGAVFESIANLDFHPKSGRLAYFAKRNKKWITVLDGRETGPAMDDWLALEWSTSGARLAAAGVIDGHSTWIVDGQPGPRFDVVSHIAFSHDEQHYAHAGAGSSMGLAKQGISSVIVLDGKELDIKFRGRALLGAWTWLGGGGQWMAKGYRHFSVDFHGVSDPEFTSRGELIFARRIDEKQVTVQVGDRSGPPLEALVSPIVTAADGDHVTYVGRVGAALVEVRDGELGTRIPTTRDFAVVEWLGQRDGRVLYAIAQGGGQFQRGETRRALRRVVTDGVSGPEYNALNIPPCRFGDRGAPQACIVIGAEGERDLLLVNNRETPLYDTILWRSVTFQPSGGVEFIAWRSRRIVGVTIDPQ